MNVHLVAPLTRFVSVVTQVSGTAGDDDNRVDISSGWTISDIVQSIWDNLTRNGYQTGVAILTATAATVIASSRKCHGLLVGLIAIGGFWLGWLGWNTAYGQDNPLFPGDPNATRIWDIASQGDRGFLVFAIMASVTSYFVWQKMAGTTGRRIFVLVAAILGASLLYNLYLSLSLA